MKINLKKAIFAVLLAGCAISASAYVYVDHTHDTPDSHSGGTDRDGCHTNSKTGIYHCH